MTSCYLEMGTYLWGRKILSKNNLPAVATRQRCGRACPKQIMGQRLAGEGGEKPVQIIAEKYRNLLIATVISSDVTPILIACRLDLLVVLLFSVEFAGTT